MRVLAFASSYLYFRVIRHRHKYVVVTGKGYRPKLIELGRLKELSVFFLILANAIKYISFGARTLNGALIQIHRERRKDPNRLIRLTTQ